MPPSPITVSSRRFSGVSQLTSSSPNGPVVREAQQARDHVLLRRVGEARALRVDARRCRGSSTNCMTSRSCVARSIATPASAMRAGSGPTRVAWARNTRPSAALANELGHLADGGVEALDVADHELAPRRCAAAAAMRRARRPASRRSASRRGRACPASSAARAISRVASRSAPRCRPRRCQPRSSSSRQSRVPVDRRRRRRQALRCGLARIGDGNERAPRRCGPSASTCHPPICPTPITPTLSSPLTPPPPLFSEIVDGQSGDALRGMAVAEERRAAPSGVGSARRLGERVGVDADEHVPAGVDRLDPLGLLAQRHAGHPPEVRLALHAAGVGRDRLRAALELQHPRVGDRLDEPDVGRDLEPPRARYWRRVRGCTGNTTGHGDRPRQARTVSRRSRIAGVVVAVDGRKHEVAARGTHAVPQRLEHVAERVAGDVDGAR